MWSILTLARPSAPSMPTERQIQDAHKTVASLYPGARIKRVGPGGVDFDYPDVKASDGEWAGKPFASESE